MFQGSSKLRRNAEDTTHLAAACSVVAATVIFSLIADWSEGDLSLDGGYMRMLVRRVVQLSLSCPPRVRQSASHRRPYQNTKRRTRMTTRSNISIGGGLGHETS